MRIQSSSPERPDAGSAWSLVSFDVDGTIFRKPALREAAHALGLQAEWDEIDDRFDQTRITLRKRLQSHYALLRGKRTADILREVARVDVIRHVREAVDGLRGDGVCVILLTDLPDFMCAYLVERFGFDAYVASNVGLRGGIVSGPIDPLPDKAIGLRTYCSRSSIPLSKCAHVGDGLNDVPVFRAVRYSIALNSTVARVNTEASHTMLTDDLLDVSRQLRSAI